MRPTTRILLAVSLIAALLALASSFVGSIDSLHERLTRLSPVLAAAVVGLAIVAASVAAIAAARVLWQLGRRERGASQPPTDVIAAAEVRAQHAERVIEAIRDASAQERLRAELAELRADRQASTFHVVVFGTGSAGKTSLINALLGSPVGKVEAVMGTTCEREVFTHVVMGVEGKLLLTDTPGLAEASAAGLGREAVARDLAARADLLIFVVDHDLIRAEFEPLAALVRQGKRSIVALNKIDRFTPDDRSAILAKLRERLRGLVQPEYVVAIAASPRPVPVRQHLADGRVETVLEAQEPDVAALQDQVAAILAREGEALRAGNLLLRAHLLGKAAQDQLTVERRARAQAVVDRYQWVTAGAVFANPIPALDLMATGAVQFQMISEIAGVYGLELSAGHVRMIGSQMVQILLKLGLVEAASSLVAGLFKSTLVGFAAGGAIQATTMAYLTHVSGIAFSEYFERGQSWGDGGMQAALVRQFELNSRAEFLQEFARQALDRVARKVAGSAAAPKG
jgi:small GTP-binding protein